MTDASSSVGAGAAQPMAAAPRTTAAPTNGLADPHAIAVQSGEAPASRTVWATLNQPFTLGLLVTLGGLVAILLGLAFWNLSTILIYIVFALFVALGLDPVVRWLERRGIARPWGIVIVFAGFAVVLVGVLLLVVPALVSQITQFFSDLPETIDDFQKSDAYAWLSTTFGGQVGGIIQQVETFLTDPGNIAAIGGGVLRFGVTVATAISGIIIVLVLSLYFLASLPTMKVAFNRLAPARNRAQVADITERITDSIGGYLMGMVVLALCNAVVALLLHLFLGLPFPALMAVVAFCVTLIPLVGSVLFWIIASGIALFTGWVPALLFAAIYLVYMQLEAYVLTPRVMNRTISVPGALVVIGALVGGTLLGLLGALVAIPVTASILLILKQVFIPKQDAKI